MLSKIRLGLSQFLTSRDGEMSNSLLDIPLSGNQTVSVNNSQPVVTFPISEFCPTFEPQLCHAIVRFNAFAPQKHPTDICGASSSEPNLTGLFARREWDVA